MSLTSARDHATAATDNDVTAARDARRWSPNRLRPYLADIVVVLGLFVFGLVIRVGSLPRDGLLFDDAWVVVGAGKTGLGQIFSSSTLQPGFTILLRPWYGLVSGRTEVMAIPSLVVGAAGGSVLYAVLRRWRIAWPICLTLSAVVAAAPVAVMYSGRVKPYVFEVVIVLVLAALLPSLSARRWGWPSVALWVGASVLLSGFSAYTLPAVVAAGVVLALHARGDRVQRWTAVVLQAVLTAAYLRVVETSFDAASTNRGWEQTWNSYIDLARPSEMAREIATHLARLGGVVAGVAGERIGFVIVVVAIAGLAWESWKGARRIPARFLLVLLAVAFVGGLTHQIPFGPARGGTPDVYPGGRASLWLVPSLIVGVAFALDWVARQIHRAPPVASTLLALLLGLATVWAVGANVADRAAYPSVGASSAHEFVEQHVDVPGAKLIVLSNAVWSYGTEPNVAARIDADSSLINGFRLSLTDSRIWSAWPNAPWNGTMAQMRERTAGARKVAIIDGYVGAFDGDVPKMETALRTLGFHPAEQMRNGMYAIAVWERAAS